MKITEDQFFTVGKSLNLSESTLNQFWTGLAKEEEASPFSKTLFYFGSLLIILSMTWLMNLGWEVFGGGGLFLIALTYALVFLTAGHLLWNKKGMRIPAGLFTTVAVSMVPLAIYGLESYLGYWPQDLPYQNFYSLVRSQWIFMEIGTLLAACITLYFYPFAFTLVPLYIAGWFLITDLLSYSGIEDPEWTIRNWMTLFYGLYLNTIGFIFDRRHKTDFGFWSYLFGTLSFFCGLNLLIWDKGEGILFLLFPISLVMMLSSILLERNVLMVFGGVGVFSYLTHLAYEIFKDSLLFPFVLSGVGLLIVYLGILYQKNRYEIKERLKKLF